VLDETGLDVLLDQGPDAARDSAESQDNRA
jgi:hypothetical protein